MLRLLTSSGNGYEKRGAEAEVKSRVGVGVSSVPVVGKKEKMVCEGRSLSEREVKVEQVDHGIMRKLARGGNVLLFLATLIIWRKVDMDQPFEREEHNVMMGVMLFEILSGLVLSHKQQRVVPVGVREKLSTVVAETPKKMAAVPATPVGTGGKRVTMTPQTDYRGGRQGVIPGSAVKVSTAVAVGGENRAVPDAHRKNFAGALSALNKVGRSGDDDGIVGRLVFDGLGEDEVSEVVSAAVGVEVTPLKTRRVNDLIAEAGSPSVKQRPLVLHAQVGENKENEGEVTPERKVQRANLFGEIVAGKVTLKDHKVRKEDGWQLVGKQKKSPKKGDLLSQIRAQGGKPRAVTNRAAASTVATSIQPAATPSRKVPQLPPRRVRPGSVVKKAVPAATSGMKQPSTPASNASPFGEGANSVAMKALNNRRASLAYSPASPASPESPASLASPASSVGAQSPYNAPKGRRRNFLPRSPLTPIDENRGQGGASSATQGVFKTPTVATGPSPRTNERRRSVLGSIKGGGNLKLRRVASTSTRTPPSAVPVQTAPSTEPVKTSNGMAFNTALLNSAGRNAMSKTFAVGSPTRFPDNENEW